MCTCVYVCICMNMPSYVPIYTCTVYICILNIQGSVVELVIKLII